MKSWIVAAVFAFGAGSTAAADPLESQYVAVHLRMSLLMADAWRTGVLDAIHCATSGVPMFEVCDITIGVHGSTESWRLEKYSGIPLGVSVGDEVIVVTRSGKMMRDPQPSIFATSLSDESPEQMLQEATEVASELLAKASCPTDLQQALLELEQPSFQQAVDHLRSRTYTKQEFACFLNGLNVDREAYAPWYETPEGWETVYYFGFEGNDKVRDLVLSLLPTITNLSLDHYNDNPSSFAPKRLAFAYWAASQGSEMVIPSGFFDPVKDSWRKWQSRAANSD